MNATQTILKITELSELDLPHIRYDAVGQLVLCPVEFIADYPTAQAEAIAERSSTSLRTLNAWEQAHIDYVFYWLNIYEPREGCSDLEQIEGYLEAFYHLCELSLWQQAYQVVCTPIDGEDFHEKLGSWGYYIQQIEIYQKLLYKIDASIDCICLNGLGYIFYLLGQNQKSFQAYKEQLKLAHKTKNYEYECQAWGGLGSCYRYFDKTKAIRCHLKQLDCAELHQVANQKLSAFLELSHIYGLWFDLKSSLHYAQQAFDFANLIGDKGVKILATKQLLSVWSYSNQYHKVKKFLMNHELEFVQDLSNLSLHEQVCIHEIIARSFLIINDHEKFIYFSHQSLKIWQQIKDQMIYSKYDCPMEHHILHNLGTFYCLKLKNPYVGIQYLERAYEVGSKGNNSLFIATTLAVSAHCYSILGKISIAQERGQAALALAEQMNDPAMRCYAMTGLASVAWHQGYYLRGLRLILQGLWGARVWPAMNTQMIIKTVLGLIGDKLCWWR